MLKYDGVSSVSTLDTPSYLMFIFDNAKGTNGVISRLVSCLIYERREPKDEMAFNRVHVYLHFLILYSCVQKWKQGLISTIQYNCVVVISPSI